MRSRARRTCQPTISPPRDDSQAFYRDRMYGMVFMIRRSFIHSFIHPSIHSFIHSRQVCTMAAAAAATTAAIVGFPIARSSPVRRRSSTSQRRQRRHHHPHRTVSRCVWAECCAEAEVCNETAGMTGVDRKTPNPVASPVSSSAKSPTS